MKFSDAIGQEEVLARLRAAADEGQVPHALMLCGPMGCGKMAVALAFASYLLGEREDGHSLLTQEQNIRNAEAMLAKWEHPDLHFSFPVIRPAGTSSDHKMVSADFMTEFREMLLQGPYFSFDQWLLRMKAQNQQSQIFDGESDAIIHDLSLKSSQGGYKVVVMWLAERMNASAANKILKILEEPPQQTVFMLVCEEPERLLDTIRSRVQRIDLRQIRPEAMVQALQERRGLDQQTAERIAHIAGGSWLRALQTLDAQNESREFFQNFVTLMRSAYARKLPELRDWSDQVYDYGREKQKRLLTYFLRMVRESFMYNFHNRDLIYMTEDEERFATRFARFINEANVLGFQQLFSRAIRDISQNANARMVFFDVAMQVIVLLRMK